MHCYHCNRVVRAHMLMVDHEVKCPHCQSSMKVPPPRSDGERPIGKRPSLAANRYFNFPCENCDSLLEGHTGLSGRSGTCPTCGVRFEIPYLNINSGQPTRAKLLDSEAQAADPTPVHAYAASGDQAPEIITGPDGTALIKCPRCNALNEVDAEHCVGCGTPFSLEGAPTGSSRSASTLAVIALVVGLLSIPGFYFVLPALLAIVLGLVAWNAARGKRRSTLALLGVMLGGVSLLIALIYHSSRFF